MFYTAWSDGSLQNNGKAYAAYVIKDENNKEERFKALIDDVYTSYEAEVASLFYLFKRVLELNLRNVAIYTDCLQLQSVLTQDKNNVPQDSLNIRHKFASSFGNKNMKLLQKLLNWESRKENLAHPLFFSLDDATPIFNFSNIFGTKLTFHSSSFNGVEYFNTPSHLVNNKVKEQRLKSANKIEKDKSSANSASFFTISFKDEQVQVPARILKTFKKSLNETDDEEVLSKLKEKMLSSTITEKGDVILFTKGRLVIKLQNSIIKDLQINGHNKNDIQTLQTNLQDLKLPESYKPYTKKVISVPGFNFSFISKTFNKYVKNKDARTALCHLEKNMSTASVFKINNFTLYVKGKLHIIMEEGVIVDIKIQSSPYAVESIKQNAS